MANALERLSADENVQQRFCLFINGLDEYHGDHRDVIKILKRLSDGKNFKLCVSSRSWNIFDNAFGQEVSKKLYIHELTRHDILRYTTSTLQEDINWRMGSSGDIRYEKLIEDITEAAQGVFLWVVLVIRSVLEGLSSGDSIRLLDRRMSEIPKDLGPFLRHILSSIISRWLCTSKLHF
jgi:hypothetical protein